MFKRINIVAFTRTFYMYVACTMSTVATARIQRRLIIIQQQRAPFTRDRHLRERVICARANEGVTMSLSRMGTSQCHFRARRHRDVTFARAETSRCHFRARGDIAMSLSRTRRHRAISHSRRIREKNFFASYCMYSANFHYKHEVTVQRCE